MRDLFRFYQCSIHERRWAARVCRSAPLLVFLLVFLLCVTTAFRSHALFLAICAVLNVDLWLLVFRNCFFCLLGLYKCREKMWIDPLSPDEYDSDGPEVIECDLPGNNGSYINTVAKQIPLVIKSPYVRRLSNHAERNRVVHFVVFPNYQEPESLLRQTLESLAQCKRSRRFLVVLAMEEREEGAAAKSQRLKEEFQDIFRQVVVTMHPKDLTVTHQDGTVLPEIPGKASNLNWAVADGFRQVQKKEPFSEDDVLVTVGDADCLFHPNYFIHIAQEFSDLKRFPNNRHQLTMWQAPQLQHRNWYPSPICTRTWGLISGVVEFGGVSSLHWGGHHMTFSSFSMSLILVQRAKPWDGDVIADDHHAFIKCFYYSVYVSAMECLETGYWLDCNPLLRVRAVFLPVKATGVQCPYWADAWKERFQQAKRHAQGVAEVGYCLLCAWEASWTIPVWKAPRLQLRICRVLLHLWHMHMLPICQSACLAYLTLVWMYNGRNIPMCPDRIWLEPRHETILCGLAGAWALVWPVAVPVAAVAFVTYMFLSFLFISPGAPKSTSVWHAEDAYVPPAFGRYCAWSNRITVVFFLFVDCIFLSPLMLPYGCVPELMAYVNVSMKGNKFKFISAAKPPAEREMELVGMRRQI